MGPRLAFQGLQCLVKPNTKRFILCISREGYAIGLAVEVPDAQSAKEKSRVWPLP